MNEIKKVKATELLVGDFFSYIGSFKIYQVKEAPRRSKNFKRKVVVVVTDGNRNENMSCRFNKDMECHLHDSFGDSPAR